MVYERIFEQIVLGAYPINARLPSEIELADRFKVSRPVVREALARLRDDQIIVSRQGSGSFVMRRPASSTIGFGPIGSIADIQRCFEFREAIEGYAAALAAERRSRADAEALSVRLEELKTAVHAGHLGAKADFSFHLAVSEVARNRFLLTSLRSVETHVVFGIRLARSLSLERPRERITEVQVEHEVIYNAIAKGDGDAAGKAMVEHLRKARLRVFEGAQS
nr:FadR/GntR family transcriptional regulator [Acuticoccus kalidii]